MMVLERLIHMRTAFLMAGALAASPSAMAAYTLVDDFEAYSTGLLRDDVTGATTSEGGIWEEVGTGTSFAQIENDTATTHLAIGWNSGFRGAYADVTEVADTDTATYYLQVRSTDDTPDASFGLSDETAPGGFGSFEVQVALIDDGDGSNGTFNLVGRTGSTLMPMVNGLVADTWYDVWLVVDNSTDTYDVFFGTTGDPDVLGTKVGNNLAFRNGTSDPLATFFSYGGSSDYSLHVDNLHYNPDAVPEPASVALASLAGACLLGRRRR